MNQQRGALVAAGAALAICAALLLWNLGAYALWDDEANTAVFAANVWKFGDTTAWDGTNLLAFRDGLELTGLKNRVYPPAQYFYAAPWLGLLGRTALAARLPFALAALAGFALWAWWLWKAKARWYVALATFIAVSGNVSLFLYSRQARYYALAWAGSLALTYLYEYRHERRRNFHLMIAVATGLLAVHYLSWGAAMVCLGVDQLLFQRRADGWKDRFIFVGSQAISLLVIVGIFNPMGRKVTPYVPQSWWDDKLTLFWWNLRDLNACEFMWTPVLGVAVVVVLLGLLRDKQLARALVAFVLYAFVASVLSVQPVGWAQVSDIRYMVAAIPLGLFITVRTFTSIPRIPGWVGLPVVALLSWSTLLHDPAQRWFSAPTVVPVRSTIQRYVEELAHPQRSAYGEASAWLNANIRDGAKVFVRPDYAAFPFMFHSPQLSQMWLLRPDQRAEYSMLPEHIFRGIGVPDVLIGFGADVHGLRAFARQFGQFELVRLDVAGPDRTRPELFWRDFTTAPVTDGNATWILFRSTVRK
ncbi:MAG: hypothetical protein ACO1OB_09185 [Archangium sp.]